MLVAGHEKPDDLSKGLKEACRSGGYSFEQIRSTQDLREIFDHVSQRVNKELEVVRQSRHRHRLEDMSRRVPGTTQVPKLPEVEEEGEASAADKSVQSSGMQPSGSDGLSGGLRPPDVSYRYIPYSFNLPPSPPVSRSVCLSCCLPVRLSGKMRSVTCVV